MTQEKLTDDGKEKGDLPTQPADLTTTRALCGGQEMTVLN